MDRFYKLSQDTINDFHDIFSKKSFPLPLKFEFLGDNKQKALIRVTKIADDFTFLLGKELKVTINEDLMNVFDEESIQILFEQEIDKISMNIDSGKIKLTKPDLTTFSSLINKYGVDKVTRANGVEKLYQEQKEDSQETDFLI